VSTARRNRYTVGISHRLTYGVRTLILQVLVSPVRNTLCRNPFGKRVALTAIGTRGGAESHQEVAGPQGREDSLKGFAFAEFLLRGDVSSIKKDLIARHLRLTDGESTRIWQVYEQYAVEMSKISGAKTTILQKYSRAYDTLTDEQADHLIRRWLDTDVEQAKLRQQFAGIFRKVLPGKKAATFLQLERRISLMMDVQISSGLPLAHNEA
jgi:hypothetical protein